MTLGANLETIGNGAFFECTSLKDIVWNEKLTRIDWSAFYSCKSLENLVLPENLEYIDDYVFQDCSGLLSVSLGSRVSNIGTECFSGLSNLKQLSIDAVNPPTLGSFVFNLTPVDKCKLIVPEESLSKYKEADQWKDFLNTTTSVNLVDAGQAAYFKITPGNVYVGNLKNSDTVSLFTLTGQKIYSGKSSGCMSLCLPSGHYIVCVNDVASKILVP